MNKIYFLCIVMPNVLLTFDIKGATGAKKRDKTININHMKYTNYIHMYV